VEVCYRDRRTHFDMSAPVHDARLNLHRRPIHVKFRDGVVLFEDKVEILATKRAIRVRNWWTADDRTGLKALPVGSDARGLFGIDSMMNHVEVHAQPSRITTRLRLLR
jgi:hypothetical protein